MLLNIQKIDLFAKECRGLSFIDLRKKYPGLALNRAVCGYTFAPPSWDHWIHTLRAHAHGRIHARKIGKHCDYAAPVKREKGSGQSYKCLNKRWSIEINTLEEQAEFIGKDFLANFVLEVDAEAA